MKNSPKNPFFSASVLSVLACLATPKLEAATFLIDFGTTSQTTVNDGTNQWNNLTANADQPATLPRTGTVPLVDVANNGSLGISMEFLYPSGNLDDSFQMNSNDAGALTSLSNLGLLNITSASRDTVWSNGAGQIPTLTFTNLDPNTNYEFTIFAYRNASGRTTTYGLAGSTTDSVVYNVFTSKDGDGTVATLSDSPDASNELVLTIAPGSGGYAYIGALQIVTSPIPEPSGVALFAGSLGLLALRRRR